MTSRLGCECESTKGCHTGCRGACRPAAAVDRRRFLVNLGRYALTAAAGVGVVSAAPRADAAADVPDPLVSSLGATLVHIPAGAFLMGGEDNDDEKPIHEVTISRPFWCAVCETSNATYRAFVEATGRVEPGSAAGSKDQVRPWKHPLFRADDQPVVGVTWEDAVAFCQWLSEREGAVYRLPTEAEWEYAYRAGTQTRFYWGDEPAGREQAYFAAASPEATKEAEGWQETPWGLYGTAPVQSEEGNPYRLCQVAGNVWEWTADWYGPYAAEPQTDPPGPAEGEKRVTRGGSRFHHSRVATASVRRPMPPDTCCRNRGFRVVREA